MEINMRHVTSLQALVKDIKNPAVLRAQITLLESWLDQDRQLEAEVIVAAVAEKMGELARSTASVAAQRERCRKIIKDVAGAMEQVTVWIDSAQVVIGAILYGTALFTMAEKIGKDVRACYAEVENIELQLHEFDFDELVINQPDLHSIMRRLEPGRGYTETKRRWLADKFWQMEKRIRTYAIDIAKRQMLPMAAELYTKWRQVADDVDKLHHLWKRSDHFGSNELTHIFERINENIDRPGAHLQNSINALGRHQELLLASQSQVEGYLVLIELLTRANRE
jgi:hypothetical protein